MTDNEIEEVKQFIRTSNATVHIVVALIEDLAPLIGYDEATRLMKIYEEAQKGGQS